MDGFAVDLDEAGKACQLETGSLAQAATMLREPIAELITYEGWNNNSAAYPFDAVDRMQATYQVFCDTLGQRHIRGCDIIDDTAEALREIITLYRRVDGQG